MTLQRIAALALSLCCGMATAPAAAHPLPGSSVLLDFQEEQVQAELHLPLPDLEIGFTHDPADPESSFQRIGQMPFTNTPGRVLPGYGTKIQAYLGRHIHPVAPDGRPWSVDVQDVSLDTRRQPADLVAHVLLRPPAGAPVGRFNLNYDVITHEIVTHEALVSVRSDWNNGVMSGEPQLLGRIRWVVKSVEVDRPQGGAFAGIKAAAGLGMQHIAEGTDHLMFLLVLLLPAPLLVRGSRWAASGGLRHALVRLGTITTAFTIGHSITLVAGAQGWLTLPPAPVEVAIAVSILVSAMHAFRPLFPGKEAWVAGGFGLIHGAAFASVIAEQSFDAWHRTLAMLGFNGGIEIMQLAVVAAVLPSLLLLSDLPVYRFIRGIGALFAAATSVGWIFERTIGSPNPLEPWVDAIANHAVVTVIVMTTVALVAHVISRTTAAARSPAA